MTDTLQKQKDEIDAINDLAWAIRDSDIEQARTLLQQAYALSTTGPFEVDPYLRGQIFSLAGLGYVHRISGDLTKATNYLEEARQLCESTGLLRAMVYVNLGKTYSLLGKLLESVHAHEEGLAAAREEGNYKYEAEALLSLANVYGMRTDFSEAISYLRQSLDLSIEKQHHRGQLRATNNLAAMYCYLGDHENAQLILEDALRLIDTENYVLESIYILATAGEIQFALGDNHGAITYLRQSLDLSKKYGIHEPLPGTLLNISRIYRQEQQVELEIEVLHQAIRVSEETQHVDSQQVCHKRLAEIYESQGNYEAALRHYKQFHVTKELIFNEAADQKLKHLQVIHETETHKQKAELQRLKNVELTQAKETAEVANKVKSAFLATMSHELRTPLNAILGFAQLMQYDTKLSPNHVAYLQSIVRSGEYLMDLIDDVLDMSKIEAQKSYVHASVFDLHQLVDELESIFTLRVQQKNLAFNLHISPNVPRWLEGDEKKLRQVLLNLIGNAVKFTSNGHVEVRINYVESRLYFEVEDTGPGIAESELDTLFVPFKQVVHQQTSNEKGTGLGLAISQAYVQLMGDSLITVSSEVGKGSLFRFDIPIGVSLIHGHPKQARQARIIGLKSGQSRHRILVVEDHSDSRQALVQLLELIGFDVREAADGKQAVKLSQEWQPHLIFMDIRLPIMDGYEAARRIKDHHASIVIIAYTSVAIDEKNKIEAGLDGILRKPMNDQLILKTIAQHLSVRYEYSSDSYSRSAVLATDDTLRDLIKAQPATWQDRLRHYATACNRDQLMHLVNEIRDQDNMLASNLFLIMKNYQFGKLVMLCE